MCKISIKYFQRDERGKFMKRLSYLLFILTIMLCNTFFLYGCTNNKSPEVIATETTVQTSTTPTETEATTAKPSEKITKSKAEDIALKDAGFNLETATVQTIEKDTEDGKEVYKIKFDADGYNYDYIIDVATGSVVQATRKNKSETTEEVVVSTNGVTLKQAKQIALNHAGTPENAVTFTKAKLDTDDGKKIYEIEFTVGNTEYEYHINATTGEIISSEKDIEGALTNNNISDNQTTLLIPASQALRIALVDSGVKEKDAKINPVDLDAENGIQYYDVSFISGKIEYEYEINAETGEIISAEKD